MNNPSDQLLARVAQIVAAGARLYYWDGKPAVALLAVEWVPGKGLLYAERGTIDQSGVHLVEAAYLEDDSVGASIEGSVDLLAEGGDLLASIMTDRSLGALPPLPAESWARFWMQEVENAKGGE